MSSTDSVYTYLAFERACVLAASPASGTPASPSKPHKAMKLSHVLISRTPAMDALEVRYGRYVLLATADRDGEEKVTPAALLATLEQRYGMLPSEVVIEVACPPHVWLTFSTEEKCIDVLFS